MSKSNNKEKSDAEKDALKKLKDIFDPKIPLAEQKDIVFKKYLDSFPCKDCDKFNRLRRNIKSIWKDTGYTIDRESGFSEILTGEYFEHFKKNHLPTKEEMAILVK